MNTSGSPTNAPEPDDQAVGQFIGPYKVLERVGEGGWGTVYVAEQQKPVRRRVALKVIKLGMDTKQVVARFEAERQALAMMDHPNIAKVLDAGATETGRPYFVMELVRGVKITKYCDLNKLSTAERLDLFVMVCQAVQHAHHKGIIHRDLKPSNIMITLHDGVPVPKVIDFGIAKATEGRLTDATIYTQLQQFIGTPAYMSPEQAEMSGLDVDTRSDIYSLGVLLYELLTGRTPFDPKELTSLGVDAMRRVIREEDPPRPSTKLSTLEADTLTATAKQRHTEAPHLIHGIRGDLDWIVMKCLEKDRTRRYETANALAADIRRHRSNEPIVAHPPSSLYRFQKLVRRNRLAFGAGVAVAVVLLLGTVVSTWQALRARQAQADWEATKISEAQRKEKALATDRLLRAKTLFLEKDYAGADALVSNLPPEVIEQEFATAGPLFRCLGHWHAGGQRWRQSANYFNQLLFGPAKKSAVLYEGAQIDGSGDLLSLTTQQAYSLIYYNQAILLLELGDREGYERLRRAVIAKYASFTDTLNLDSALFVALALPPEARDRTTICKWAAIAQFNRDVGGHAWRKWLISLLMYRRDEPQQSLKWAQQSLDEEPSATVAALARTMKVMDYWKLGREDLARKELAWCREQINEKFRGEFEVGTIGADFWADWLEARLLLREAEQLMATTSSGGALADATVSDVSTKQSGPTWDQAMDQAWEEAVQSLDNSDDAGFVTQVGRLVSDAGRLDLAEQALRRALAIQEKAYGSDSDQATDAMHELCLGLCRTGKFSEAEGLIRKALAIQEKRHYRRPRHFGALDFLGMTLNGLGRFEEGEAACREALSIEAEIMAGNPDWVPNFWLRRGQGMTCYLEGRYQEAEELLREAIVVRPETEKGQGQFILIRKNGPNLSDDDLTLPIYLLAESLVAEGQYQQAEAVYREELQRRENSTNRYAWDGALRPQEVGLRFQLSQLERLQGKRIDTTDLMDEAVRQAEPLNLNQMAWSLATSAEPARRGGPVAVRLAQKAVEATGRTNASPWGRRDPWGNWNKGMGFPLATLAAAYAEAGDFEKAVAIQRETLTLLAPYNNPLKVVFESRIKLYQAKRPYHDVQALEAKARRHLTQGQFDDAETAASECLAIRRIMYPDDWSTYDTMSLLGAIYLAQRRFDDAKPLLHDGYAGLKENEGTLPTYAKMRLMKAAERLVQLYESTGQTEMAAKLKQSATELNPSAAK